MIFTLKAVVGVLHSFARNQGPKDQIKAGEEFEAEITLKNPFARKAMTGCKLTIEGSVKVTDGGFKEKHGHFLKDIG
ncbi:hypothetical protein ElyMa_006568800 [Elysia marginata]|uniref:Arrestin-like N-terminal domain-containing protein n=1 Tax=Elysia marginata TaxID=1093978 RepID=A0AAV4ICJ4_9GAST|nr:hypothetical protein ElyMa_006568800 [Elysia marginata]